MTRILVFLAATLLSAGLSSAALAQEPPFRVGGAATDTNPAPTKLRCWSGSAWGPCAFAVQESFQLVAANTPASPVSVFGGDYILSQTCGGYGTLTLQARGPDGSTWQTLLTKTASDTTSGTGLALGSYAVVRITVTGTTSCNAILSRVPA